ncbi:unannotated protein [freshwater metagenome]|uniref:Unannotated protein n=1 Tax=freshwater metagenome TaxID=449393 RepID=A0A6J7DE48_9ZZZZ|nr:hypothetical protein [Actinomycetota bacterium]
MQAPFVKTLAGALFLVGISVPTAHGLEFPATTRLVSTYNFSGSLVAAASINLGESAGTPIGAQANAGFFSSEMAKVAFATNQSEMARNSWGAKTIAKTIMAEEYNWGEYQYSCLNRLWTKESHWNYQAHNYRSGAHGIAQALPAVKMEIIATDWRTNPVTQIRWGLHYIELRYETPCKAWKKFRRSHYY